MVPVTVDGEAVKLALITYKPAGPGPFPTLIFQHGSTGRGNDPSLFARSGFNGHQISGTPQLWSSVLENCLSSRGLEAKA